MAKVNTNRPEAAAYRGRDLKFVREVGPGEPSFDERMHQVVLSDGGTEVQFFANEVQLSDDEKGAADKAKKKFTDERKEADEAARKNIEGKNAMLKQTAAGSSDDQKPEPPKSDAAWRMARQPCRATSPVRRSSARHRRSTACRASHSAPPQMTARLGKLARAAIPKVLARTRRGAG
jgi:hypothetical protein